MKQKKGFKVAELFTVNQQLMQLFSLPISIWTMNTHLHTKIKFIKFKLIEIIKIDEHHHDEKKRRKFISHSCFSEWRMRKWIFSFLRGGGGGVGVSVFAIFPHNQLFVVWLWCGIHRKSLFRCMDWPWENEEKKREKTENWNSDANKQKKTKNLIMWQRTRLILFWEKKGDMDKLGSKWNKIILYRSRASVCVCVSV